LIRSLSPEEKHDYLQYQISQVTSPNVKNLNQEDKELFSRKQSAKMESIQKEIIMS